MKNANKIYCKVRQAIWVFDDGGKMRGGEGGSSQRPSTRPPSSCQLTVGELGRGIGIQTSTPTITMLMWTLSWTIN